MRTDFTALYDDTVTTYLLSEALTHGGTKRALYLIAQHRRAMPLYYDVLRKADVIVQHYHDAIEAYIQALNNNERGDVVHHKYCEVKTAYRELPVWYGRKQCLRLDKPRGMTTQEAKAQRALRLYNERKAKGER
jgi:hypothetical protein